MKVVLSWVFEHIAVSFDTVNISDVVKQLSIRTTEIESITTVLRKQDQYLLLKVQSIDDSTAQCVDASGKSYEIHYVENQQPGAVYLVFFDDEKNEWRFAHAKDLGASREFVLPSLDVAQHVPASSLFPERETVLTIDNNAIAHRPDLWNHRGIAREIAAIYGYELKPLEHMVTQKRLVIDPVAVSATPHSPFSITIEDKNACSRFAGLFIKSLKNRASLLDMVAKLSLVDCRSINAIVDCTNYVLFDIGQPLHAYDADMLTGKRLVARYGDQGSELLLLDGQTVKLSKHDIVITDGLNPVAVAGVMGGHETGVTQETKSIFVESACFDPVSIRQTAKRLGKRTESALRFSRGVDQNQNVFGIMRFLHLLDAYHIQYVSTAEIQSVGVMQDATAITVRHDFIEKRIGTTISEHNVLLFLSRLGFRIEKTAAEYVINVPSFRAKKDISIQEDIVEEVARLFGYDSVELQLPKSVLVPKQSVEMIRMLRAIKNVLSFGFKMREVYTYSVFDESFLHRISYDPVNSIFLKNPISENRKRLVTSLVPHLLEAIWLQKDSEDVLRFYEIARVWRIEEGDHVGEEACFAGVFFDKTLSQRLNVQHFQAQHLYAKLFYDVKSYFEQIVAFCDVQVSCVSKMHEVDSWYDDAYVACILHAGSCIGHIGKISGDLSGQLFEEKVVYAFECKLLPFLTQKTITQFQEISKFPVMIRDINLVLSHTVAVADIQRLLHSLSEKIADIFVLDVFEKKEWHGERAVTFRFVFQDSQKTLLSEEVDIIMKTIQSAIQKKGIQIR
jgi:phenylalanyl-tRNA synthetase beta chain